MSLAASTVHADSLLLDGPQAVDRIVGWNLVIHDNDVMIVADHYTLQPLDRILRSSFDTSFWYWQVVIDGALAEGWGQCVLVKGPPDAALRCDS
jgi:hypothetical protein